IQVRSPIADLDWHPIYWLCYFLVVAQPSNFAIFRAYIMVPALIAIAMLIIVKVPSHDDTNIIK
ncbi:MAG: hypothetical protein EBR75_03640, partial [Actinobacteria bacterium]|nr:hypothetical protein [Actinomycetota bacterium]